MNQSGIAFTNFLIKAVWVECDSKVATFFNIPEGSKVAMVKLVEHLRRQDFKLFDVQMMNPHLERFGAVVVKKREYDRLLKDAIAQPCDFLI